MLKTIHAAAIAAVLCAAPSGAFAFDPATYPAVMDLTRGEAGRHPPTDHHPGTGHHLPTGPLPSTGT